MTYSIHTDQESDDSNDMIEDLPKNGLKNGGGPDYDTPSSSSMNLNDDRDGCRSLVCDSNGIIVAEIVYRCMICPSIYDSILDVRKHYKERHIDSTNNSYGSDENENDNGINSYPMEEDMDPGFTTELIEEPVFRGFNGPKNARKTRLGSRSSSSGSATLNIVSQEMPSNSMASPLPVERPPPGSATGWGSKGGHITCAVCGVTRYYSYIQRRYGQFSCVACSRFFGTFFMKPQKYVCPNLGTCPLNIRSRCRACWIYACMKAYTIDSKRKQIFQAYRPVRRSSGDTSVMSKPFQTQTKTNQVITNNNNDKIQNENSKPSSIPKPPPLTPKPSLTVDPTTNDENNEELKSNFSLKHILPRPSQLQIESMQHENCPLSPSDLSPRPSIFHRAIKAKAIGKKIWPCGKCITCLAPECGSCLYCRDKPKFGGTGIKKQRCLKRRCVAKEKRKSPTTV